jgi:hypothetical protein
MKKNIEETINKLCSLTIDGFEESSRRLDRLEEGLCAMISRRIEKDDDEYYSKPALIHLKAIYKEIYEEKAVAEGERNE